MRLLYASHTYLVNENQKKLAAIAALPQVEALAAVVPHAWKEPVLLEITPHQDPKANFELFPTPIAFSGNEMRYFYRSVSLQMRRFKPDYIVVENGPGAFAYTQFILYQQMYAPKAKNVFFTWWNLPYHPRLPLRLLERWNLQNSAGAITGNQAAANILHNHGWTGPTLVLPQLGVDEKVFAPGDASALKTKLGIEPGVPVIGYAGRLVPEKGLRVLMAALNGIDAPFDLLVLGRGPLAAELTTWSKRLAPHQRLHLLESVPHTAVADYMRAMDIFVLPSLSTDFWLEQFGHVLIEAMACGVCTVGSSSAEIPNVIGDAGVVVPEGDGGFWRMALRQLLGDKALRAKYGAAGRKRVLEKYTHTRIAQQTVDFLQSLP